ncbi:MAG: argininosuccinate lyase [Herpetosiphonaceae bacterium]|nr:MAG: argininosuccinate lyase [Herpetosiphonaceae bacterium]
MSHQLWGGRFAEPTAAEMREFNDSFRFDRRLAEADIAGSIAYARALARSGIITEQQRDALITGLEQVHREFAESTFIAREGDEDIHTAVERRLFELIGPVAGMLHTGRSRNDQVATDFRLWCLWACDQLEEAVSALQGRLVDQAEAHVETLMPGYTHLQRAQPITFAQWCLAYATMLARDRERLRDCRRRTAVLPLGASALAGNALGLDRESLLQDLPFERLSENSLDAVSDRDFAAELLFCCTLLGAHLSRLAEDVILYSTAEFGFLTLADAYSTGSSLMPQKRNPDSMELLRGKAGRLLGDLVALLTVIKGIPLAYNKDLQEDKEPVFDAVDTLLLALRVAAGAVATWQVHTERMAAALDDAMLATDLADELVRLGMPFREAHSAVGRLVRRAEELCIPLRELPAEELAAAVPALDIQRYRSLFDHRRSVERRSVIGGTAPTAVRAQIARLRQQEV